MIKFLNLVSVVIEDNKAMGSEVWDTAYEVTFTVDFWNAPRNDDFFVMTPGDYDLWVSEVYF